MLHAGRQCDSAVIEAVVHAIGNGAIVEQRCENLMHRLQYGRVAPHVEECFLLAGERRFRQIFRRCGGTHGDRDLLAAAHAPELFQHRFFQLGREGCGENPLADLLARHRELLDVFNVEIGQRATDAFVEPGLLQEVAVGLCRGGETTGNAHTGIRERADHLTERGILAADDFDVALTQTLEAQNIRSCVQSNPR